MTVSKPVPHRRRRSMAVRTALAAVSATAGCAGLAPGAHAGTFEVSQCNDVNQSPWGPQPYQASRWSTGGDVPGILAGCTGDGAALTKTVANHRLAAGQSSQTFVELPARMTNTRMVAAHLAYSAAPQISSTNPAYFSFFAEATQILNVGSGSHSWGARHMLPSGTRWLQFSTWCSPVNGPGYCNWSGPISEIRGLTFELEESADPSIDASGALLDGSVQAGTRPLRVIGSDADSGIKTVKVTLGGVVVATADFTASCDEARFSPCPTSADRVLDIDTTKVADGSRLLRAVATDLAGNSRTVDAGYVDVDNVPAPTNSAEPKVSGEKRVNRLLSGTAGTWVGENVEFAYRWQRYVGATWENIPDATSPAFTTTVNEVGLRLRFRVTASNAEGSTVAYSDETEPIAAAGATDADGDFDGDGIRNEIDPDDDNDGVDDADDTAVFDPAKGAMPSAGGANATPTIVVQPGSTSSTTTNNNTTVNHVHGTVPNGSNHSIKAITRIEGARSRAVRNGRAATVRGRLLDENGRGIGGAVITVSERMFVPGIGFADGSRMVPVGTITTRADGSFIYTSKPGPSRVVQFGYKAFKDAGEFAWTSDVTLLVAGKASLRTDRNALRNGQAVTFSGAVARPVPASGIQVQMQAKSARGWVTFKTARANSAGRYKTAYRFTSTSGTQRYRFRAKVVTDSSYGYRPTLSRTVVVRVTGR